MPPGNSNKKPVVVERCSYCGSPSCSGERNHFVTRFDANNYGYVQSLKYYSTGFETRNIASPGITPAAKIPVVLPSSKIPDSGDNVLPNKTVASAASTITSDKTESSAPKPTVSVSSQLSGTGGNVGLNKIVPSANPASCLGPITLSSRHSSINQSDEIVRSITDRVVSNKIPDITTVSNTSTTVPAPRPLISQMSGTVIASASNDVCTGSNSKVLCKNDTDVKQDTISSSIITRVELDSWINTTHATATQDGGECQSSVGNDLDIQDPLKKHSKKACIFEGVVTKFIGKRIAEVRIAFPDGRQKLAQLFVEKFHLHKNEPACEVSMDIKSVLQVRDIIKLVCTEHKKKDSGYDYFAHQAWLEDDSFSCHWTSNDAESVNSFASYGSLHDSEKQQSTSANRRRRRKKKKTNKQTSNDLGVNISQWLDDSSQLDGNLSQSAAITEGCEYFGKVVKLCLPYAFLVEVEINKGSQYIFVYSKYFYPDGPQSSSMTQALSIKGIVSIGDSMVVIPTRSNQQKSTDYEWVARKAWPKGKESAAFGVNQNNSEKAPKNYVEQYQPKSSAFVWIKSDQDGTILSLKTDWGLVKELSNERVFVFTRKNSYLFGVPLKNFVLEDVLQEGDLVKFSQEEGDLREMNASNLYYGCRLPDFNSFVEAIHDYCEVRNIKLSIETDLTLLGEEMYSFK